MFKIPYGLHVATGEHRAPTAEQDGVGLRAGVVCLGCDEQLQHVRGNPTHYYRHDAALNADADACAETALHIMAKNMVSKLRGPIRLPKWHHVPIAFEAIRGETEVSVSSSRKPVADAALWNESGQILAIEVKVAHGKGPEDVAAYRAAGVPAIEIDMLEYSLGYNTGGEGIVRKAILGSEWLVPPRDPIDEVLWQCPVGLKGSCPCGRIDLQEKQ